MCVSDRSGMIGKTISHYEILEKLGEGGMGIVYRAEDTKLKRIVALKFLRPQAFGTEEQKERFIREAQLTASLDHPHICTVYEIDESDDQIFISMAYTEGVTLKERIRGGPLQIDDAVRLAVQVSRGLAAAHEKDIVHRDIKSTNIMITTSGHAKIMDFGLAKITGGKEISKTTAPIGSAAYMSPEQARSESVDRRTDIWSLGVVLYEMVSGQLPFQADFEPAVVYSILNEDVVPLSELQPEVHPDLERIVDRMLAKDADARYGSVLDVLDDLSIMKEKLDSQDGVERRARKKKEPSIAVLPFSDMSPHKDQEYFCDGIAEEIINALAKVEGMRVVARTSSFLFKGGNEDIRDIGRRLKVEAVLEGSVRKAGNQLRITTQLTKAADGFHMWSERYDREMEDVFAIQDDITLAIVNKLKVTLLGEDWATSARRHTPDLEAYNMYLNGRFFWNKRTEGGYQKGLAYFERAITKDPTYALAYVGIADCYDLLGWYDYVSPTEAFPKARAAARKALELDDSLAEAHASLGWISINYDWDWAAGESDYLRAIELNPSYATVHQWYAEYLSYMGRHDEAIAEGERAHELDPLSLIINNDLGQVFYFARQYDRAVEQLRKTLEMDPNFTIAHFFTVLALTEKGEYNEALRDVQKAMELSGGGDPLIVALLGTVNAFAGEKEKAKVVLGKLTALSCRRYVSPFWLALVHVGLGETDRSFEWLENAFEERDHWLETSRVHPMLDSLRSDPRYGDLLDRMGFTE
jgi:serine/threonine-protein kinase